MLSTREWIALGILLAAPALRAQDQTAGAAAAPTPHHQSNKAPKEVALPPMPSGPLSPLPMDQMPAAPAKVSYEGGLLTISAQNSTLGEILRDVRKLTGASIEIPQGSGANERVVTKLGPGAPRDVLAGLLNGSSFNYVMVGSNSDPTAVSSVILTAKPSSSGDIQTAANVGGNVYEANPAPHPGGPFQSLPFRPSPGAQGSPGSEPAASADNDDSKDDDDKDDDSAADQTQPDGANAQDQQQQPDPNQPNAGPKTPEQMLELMRARTQQQPGGVPGNPPPQPPQPPQQ